MTFTSLPIVQSVDLHCITNTSNKVYYLRIVDCGNGKYRVEANYGMTGNPNRYEDKSKGLVTLSEAQNLFAKVQAQKTGKRGYVVVGTSPSSQTRFAAPASAPQKPVAQQPAAPAAPAATKAKPAPANPEMVKMLASIGGGIPVFQME